MRGHDNQNVRRDGCWLYPDGHCLTCPRETCILDDPNDARREAVKLRHQETRALLTEADVPTVAQATGVSQRQVFRIRREAP